LNKLLLNIFYPSFCWIFCGQVVVGNFEVPYTKLKKKKHSGVHNIAKGLLHGFRSCAMYGMSLWW
jgi:hypothetical protein